MSKEELKKEAEEKCVCTDEAMRIMYGIGYIDGAEPREKQIADLEWQLQEVAKDNDYYQAENKRLEEQIEDLKDYILKVSKFLHNNNNVRPDELVYKERDILLIKELKLFEKWE